MQSQSSSPIQPALATSVPALPTQLPPEFLQAQDAEVWFTQLGGQEASAWFTEEAAENLKPAHDRAQRLFRAVRVLVDITIHPPEPVTLRKGGALLQNAAGVFYAMQPEHFFQRFSRCLSDGVPITRLSVSLNAQTIAIAHCHAVLQTRTAKVGRSSWFKSLFSRAAVIREGAELLTLGSDLSRHIADVRFMSQPVLVPTAP